MAANTERIVACLAIDSLTDDQRLSETWRCTGSGSSPSSPSSAPGPMLLPVAAAIFARSAGLNPAPGMALSRRPREAVTELAIDLDGPDAKSATVLAATPTASRWCLSEPPRDTPGLNLSVILRLRSSHSQSSMCTCQARGGEG